MKTRVFGSTQYRISEIGFGAWGLGGDDWLGVHDDDARWAIAEAIEQSITFFDTALAYGNGHSERLIARVLQERRAADQVVVATKIPPLNYEWPGDGNQPIGAVFPAGHVVDCIEKSRQHLDTDVLELVQLHVWHDNWLNDPEWHRTYDTMLRLKEEGKVRHWGVSVNDHTPETSVRILQDPLVETAQLIFNIYDRSPEQTVFVVAKSLQLGIIVRVPLDEGALSGRLRTDTVFPAGDWREVYFAGERKAEAARRAGALEALLGDEASTLPELALRFCLSSPHVTTVIPGMRRREHVRANATVSDGRLLSQAMLMRLKAHAWKKNWYLRD